MREIFISFILTLALCARAQTQLDKPLAFVPADSIVGMGFDRTDLRRTAILTGNGENVPTISAQRLAPGDFKRELRAWQRQILPSFTLSGISGAADGDEAVISASRALDAAARLLLLTADASFADAIERLTFNQLLATAAQPGPSSFAKSYALRAVARAAGMAYATDDEGVFVNFYMNGSATVHAGSVKLTLDVVTRMPEQGIVKVRIGSLRHEGTPLKLRVRIPLWADGKAYPEGRFAMVGAGKEQAEVYVNGRPPLNVQLRSGYMEIEREWNNGDELMLRLPTAPVFVRHADKGRAAGIRGQLAVVCGPLVYAPQAATDSCYAVATIPPEVHTDLNRQGHIQLLLKMFCDKGIPADAKAPERFFLLQPFMDCPPTASPWLREPK